MSSYYFGALISSVLSILPFEKDLIVDHCLFDMCYSPSSDGGAISIFFFKNKINITSTTFYVCTGVEAGAVSIQNAFGSTIMNNICYYQCKGKQSTVSIYLLDQAEYHSYNSYIDILPNPLSTNLDSPLAYIKSKNVELESFNVSNSTADCFRIELNTQNNIVLKHSFLYNILYYSFSSNDEIRISSTYLIIPNYQKFFQFSSHNMILFNSCYFKGTGIEENNNNTMKFVNCLFDISYIEQFSNSTSFILINPSFTPEQLHFPLQYCDTSLIKGSEKLTGIQNETLTSYTHYKFTVEECIFKDLKSSTNKAGAISIEREFIISIIHSTFMNCISDDTGAIYLEIIKIETLEKNCFSNNIGNKHSDCWISKKSSENSIANYFSFSYGNDPAYFCQYIYYFGTSAFNLNYFNISNPLVVSKVDESNSNDFQMKYSYFANITAYSICTYAENCSAISNIFIYINYPSIHNSEGLCFMDIGYIENCTFYHIIGFTKIFEHPNMLIVNSYIDNETIATQYGFNYSTERPSQNNLYNFNCYALPSDKNKLSKLQITLIAVSLCVGVLAIIIAILMIYNFKFRRDSKRNRERLQLSQDILNDFG